jgi:predicted RND superfamily exporter protein
VLIQSALFRAGCFVQRYAWFIIVSLLTLFTFCSIGLRKVHIETDIVKLWVSG